MAKRKPTRVSVDFIHIEEDGSRRTIKTINKALLNHVLMPSLFHFEVTEDSRSLLYHGHHPLLVDCDLEVFQIKRYEDSVGIHHRGKGYTVRHGVKLQVGQRPMFLINSFKDDSQHEEVLRIQYTSAFLDTTTEIDEIHVRRFHG